MPGASRLQAMGEPRQRRRRRRKRRLKPHQRHLHEYLIQLSEQSRQYRFQQQHHMHQQQLDRRGYFHLQQHQKEESQQLQIHQRQNGQLKQQQPLRHSSQFQSQYEQQQQQQKYNRSKKFSEREFGIKTPQQGPQTLDNYQQQLKQLKQEDIIYQEHQQLQQNLNSTHLHPGIKSKHTKHYPYPYQQTNKTSNKNVRIFSRTQPRHQPHIFSFPTNNAIHRINATAQNRQINTKTDNRDTSYVQSPTRFKSFTPHRQITDIDRHKIGSILREAVNIHRLVKQPRAIHLPFINEQRNKTQTNRTGWGIYTKATRHNITSVIKIAGGNLRFRKRHSHSHLIKLQDNKVANEIIKEKGGDKEIHLEVTHSPDNDSNYSIKNIQNNQSRNSTSPVLKPFSSDVSTSEIEASKGTDRGVLFHQNHAQEHNRLHTGNRYNRTLVHRNSMKHDRLINRTNEYNGLKPSEQIRQSSNNLLPSPLPMPLLPSSSLSLSSSSSSSSPSSTSSPSSSAPHNSYKVQSKQLNRFLQTTLGTQSTSLYLKNVVKNITFLQTYGHRLPLRKRRDTSPNFSNQAQRLPPIHQLPNFFDVVGILGAYTSSLSVEVADVMTIFNLPQISHAATTDILGDTSKYPVFFRTVPADHYQIQAMVDLLRHFGWKYVSIVFSADAYGTRAEKSLKILLRDFDICVAQSVELNDSMVVTDYNNVIFTLRSHRNARVVVLYADIKHISPLMTAVRKQNAYHEFIWAGSDTTSLVSDMEVENCKHIIGSLSITMTASAPPKFKEYLYQFLVKHQKILKQFARKDAEKVYALFHEFLDVVRLKPYIDKKYFERLYYIKYIPTFTVSYAIDAVYAFANAIQNFIRDKCPGATGEEAKRCVQGNSIIPYLREVDFQGTSGRVSFNEYGDVVGRIAISQCQMQDGVAKQVPIATWDATAKRSLHFHSPRQWPNESTSVPKSLCANACTGNEIYVFPKQTCCWHCVKCKVNEITILNKTHCSQCPDLYWPDETTFLICHKIKPSYIRMRDLLPLALAIITTLGLMISFITGFTFFTYRTDRIIRSSSRELSSIMLVGIFCAFLLVLSLLSEPTILKCYINHIGFGMTFTLVYGPLLVKTNRIYRIFTTSRKSAALPKRTSSAWQMLFASGFILVQVTIVTISILFAPPKVTHSMPEKTDKYVIGYCDLRLAGFLPSIAYNFALVLICTWYAFKTRRFPDNYNESRYIAFCVDTTVLVWVTFIPTYFAMKRPYYKVVILALALLINSIVCLLLLFVPKLYTLYLSKQRPASQGDGRDGGRDFHMQLMSNFSMSGLIRSTPSFYNGDSNDVDEKTDSVLVQSPPLPPPSNKKTSLPMSSLCSNNEHGVRFVSSTAVLITANSQSDS